jgi:cytidyltransferase-like protein
MSHHHTSLIGLKPEFAEQYIILHKHTFPEVLDRIAQSNIRNYSIFLHGNLLFSHYEYRGDNYNRDMALMGDEVTREWWKLTDAMQEPLATRHEGEWWAAAEQLFAWENPGQVDGEIKRMAFRCDADADGHTLRSVLAPVLQSASVQWTDAFKTIILSSGDGCIYGYAELTGSQNAGRSDELKELLTGALSARGIKTTDFADMKEVFHTNMKAETIREKVFVTGCFDMLHSGHAAFLQEAAGYGDVYVCIGSDENVFQLKGRYPVNSQEERTYMLNSVKYVRECAVNTGFGVMDFLDEIERIKPGIFIVNEDGNTPAKAELCKSKGIEYKVLKRLPHGNLPRRSTTGLRKECNIPYRIDLAGGWLDQPWVSKYFPGPVLTISIEPTIEFNHRSGMSTSTRLKAIELWKTELPRGDREQIARVLFAYENPPGTQHVSGSQDSLGIVLPCLNKLNYSAGYWPESIESCNDEAILQWIENSICLIPLGPRKSHYSVVDNTNITRENVATLSEAARNCWEAILTKNLEDFGRTMRESFEAQVAMFPNMADQEIFETIDIYRDKVKGWKLSGAGGGGYLIFVTDRPLENALKIKIRRGND